MADHALPDHPEDHLALQEEIDRELGTPAVGVLGSMEAHGVSWLSTRNVLGEGDYPDFESEPAANRAAVRIQDRLAVVSPGEPYQGCRRGTLTSQTSDQSTCSSETARPRF